MNIKVGKWLECTKAPELSPFYTVGNQYEVIEVGSGTCRLTDNISTHLWNTEVLAKTKELDHPIQFKLAK